MEKVAIYVRVSTSEQSVDMQTSDLRHYCEQRGFEIYKEYSDEISGTKDRRPGLDDLMADAKKRKFDVVLVWRFDRFARSTKHLVTALEEFKHLGIDFISYQENIDTSSPLGKAIFTIISAIGELERNIIVERVKAGLRNAKAKGKRLGRRPKIDERLLRTVSGMRGKGMSIRGISSELGVSKSLVHKSIKIVRQNPLSFQ
jgi:DNA invertase Pin-like site-specific DNA recombinase